MLWFGCFGFFVTVVYLVGFFPLFGFLVQKEHMHHHTPLLFSQYITDISEGENPLKLTAH